MNTATTSLTGKTAVVTGGGSGIGRAISRKLAAAGAHVVIFDLTAEAGEQTLAEIREAGHSGNVVACDVGDTESTRRAFASLDRLDLLINNAGIAHIGTVEQTSPDDLDRIYQVNVKGVYHCLHFGVPLMLKNSGGAIVNMCSIAAKVGIPDRFAYSMAKGAVYAMTLSTARDYVSKGIRCNCICPARIHTPFVDGYLEKHYPDNKAEMFAKLSAFQPIGRMGTSDEVAFLTAFLCSDEAAFITGASYDLDGGVISLR